MKDNRKKSGFTLLEVMVVLLLVSMLMGIGIGAFSKVGGGPRLARSQIREVIRTTRHQALRERAPAVVLVDAARNRIVGVGWKRVGGWHFEESKGGSSRGFPVDATLDSGCIGPGGVIGNCLDLSDGASTGVTIPAFPSLNSVAGVSIELYVRFPAPARRSLVAKGNYYAIDIDEEGVLQGRLKLVPAAERGTVTPELYQIVAENYRIPLGRWVKIALHFNGYSSVLTADGVIIAEEEFKERKRLLTDQIEPIRVGNAREPFTGWVDEVRIGIAVTGDEMTLPETVRIEKAPRRITFDREGHLDRHHHTTPVEILLTYGEGRRSRVTVGLFGEVWSP